jgi:DNA (cytosine-5)-methyltransferase 1
VSDPVLIDLFCAAGGASEGYRRAGFRVVGVDLAPQPHYPFEFIRADALAFLADRDRWEAMGAAAWAASPPCFANSVLNNLHKMQALGYVDMIPETRAALIATGLPYVIENVPGADMIDPLILCGSMFGLGAHCRDGVHRQLRRHRLFESNVPLLAPHACAHTGQAIGVHGGGPKAAPRQPRAIEGRGGYTGTMPEKREAMGIGWMNRAEINLAIPPVYTEWIGRQLIGQLGLAAA